VAEAPDEDVMAAAAAGRSLIGCAAGAARSEQGRGSGWRRAADWGGGVGGERGPVVRWRTP